MQRKRLIVHAGMHKTGTSAIQNYLYDHFQHDSIEYISRDIANSSLWMRQAFQGNANSQSDFCCSSTENGKITETRKTARKEFEDAIQRGTKPIDVISAESIATFGPEELQNFYDFISPFYETITIHQYIRSMKSWMESAFQEQLKNGFTRISEKVGLNYYTRVNMLDAVFGRENVYNYKYSSANFQSGGVVRHFLSELGIECDARTFSKANAGLSFQAVQLLYVYRMHYPIREPEDSLILEKLSEISGPALRFHSSLYTDILVTGPRSIERFEARAGFSISENITANDDRGIVSEKDLLELPDVSIDWLANQLDQLASPTKVQLDNLPSIADGVRALGSVSDAHPIL
jgi:hypothetical protein